MSRDTFEELVNYMIDTYGVRSHRDNDDSEEDELWFECPECGDIVEWGDWREDEELGSGCCPICGHRLVEEEE